ncbi:MAG: hypothetical protein WBW73_06025 [Rhodoplanes sp.]
MTNASAARSRAGRRRIRGSTSQATGHQNLNDRKIKNHQLSWWFDGEPLKAVLKGLTRYAGRHAMPAIRDLETALNFPGVSDPLRSLIQSRLTAIQTFARASDLQLLDRAIEEHFFEHKISHDGLLGEFLLRHALHKPQRVLRIPFVDALSSVSVYRWKGDWHYGETWTQLIRKARGATKQLLHSSAAFSPSISRRHRYADHGLQRSTASCRC